MSNKKSKPSVEHEAPIEEGMVTEATHRRRGKPKAAAENGKAKTTAAYLPFPSLARFLRDQTERNEYSELAASTCAYASMSAYADKDSFLQNMSSTGWEEMGEGPHAIIAANDAILLKTTAYWMRSGSVGILCFRGTELMNPLAWLSDTSVELERFYTWGKVYSSVYRSLWPVWGAIDQTLQEAFGLHPQPSHTSKLAPVDNLLICGHSLGGALAVLTAAMLHLTTTPEYAHIRERMRGVYTFGQPLVGDREFCTLCEDRFGKRVFRHIYENDLVTQLPPQRYGEFSTLGEEYVSTPQGWTHHTVTKVTQARTFLTTMIPAAIVWYLKKLPVLRWANLSGGLEDHRPDNYVNCSRLTLQNR